MSPDDPRHGTEAGYRAHYTHLEKPCPPCREAGRRRAQLNEAKRGARPWHRCDSCGKQTRASGADCASCRAVHRALEKAKRDESSGESPFALTRGQWVPRDGIMRWEKAS